MFQMPVKNPIVFKRLLLPLTCTLLDAWDNEGGDSIVAEYAYQDVAQMDTRRQRYFDMPSFLDTHTGPLL